MPKRKAEQEATKEEDKAKAKRQQEQEQHQDEDVEEEEQDEEVEEEEEEEEEDDDEDSCPEQSESGAESEDDADGEAYKEINVEFEFFDAKEKDFHGLKALLHTYLDGQQYDCSGFVDAIIAQQEVGSVVKTSEDDDPIAVMTVFNTQKHKDKQYMQEIQKFMISKCSDAAIKEKLQKALDSPATGLLLSERLINCPPKLAPPLLQFLMEEVEAEAKEGETQEARDAFTFERYLVLTRVYSDPLEVADGEEGGAGPSKPKAAKAKGPTIVYVRPEDEYLHQVAAWSFTFPVEGRPVGRDELAPLRCVMLVEGGKVGEARQMLDLVVGNMAAGQDD